MEGVILFADNDIFKVGTFENLLFNDLNSGFKFPVLPINSLDVFEKTTKSISTFRAIILDWNFNDEEEFGGIEDLGGARMPPKTPSANLTNTSDVLKLAEIYSLVFIYSRTPIGIETQGLLKHKFGSKIEFIVKGQEKDVKIEKEKLLKRLEDFEKNNLHLQTPFSWSNAINKSVQSIFRELESADKFWVKDLYYSSFMFDRKGNPIEPPPIDPNIQVITLFQNLLAEQLIQDTNLQSSIEKFSKENFKNKSDDKALQGLYKRLYYTATLETDTVMTGDIYEISEDNFGIVISPECDMYNLIKKDAMIELLCFHKDGFNNIDSILNIKEKENKDDIISRAYNQEPPRIHLLPIFPATKGVITALIDFRFCLQHHRGSFLEANKKLRRFKINSPYIQQLRQRYLSYIGRVGVPAIPSSLRITK